MIIDVLRQHAKRRIQWWITRQDNLEPQYESGKVKKQTI